MLQSFARGRLGDDRRSAGGRWNHAL